MLKMNTYTITIYKTIQQYITKFPRDNRSIELSLNNKLRVTLNPKRLVHPLEIATSKTKFTFITST